jgi:hypothetical protein
MESWRKAWREGFMPQYSVGALTAFRTALGANDRGLLMQGGTCDPFDLQHGTNAPCKRACGIGFCGWMELAIAGGEYRARSGPNPVRVAEVEESFANACFEADRRLGEPVGCRWFLNWWDEAPWEQVRTVMLAELADNLQQRAGGPTPYRSPALPSSGPGPYGEEPDPLAGWDEIGGEG